MKILEEVVTTENFDAHQDWEVPIPAFIIIAPKDKTKKSITDFNDEETTELAFLTKKLREAMRTVLHIETVYFFQNEDSEHGFHIWVFPRYAWMEQFGKKIQSVRPIMEYAKENLFTEENLVRVREDAKLLRGFFKSAGEIKAQE